MIGTLAQLEARERERPPGYREAIAPALTFLDDGRIEIDEFHPAWLDAVRRFAPEKAKRRRREASRQPSWVQDRIAICNKCKDKPECGIYKSGSPCRAKNLLKRPGMVCPGEPPKWGSRPAAESKSVTAPASAAPKARAEHWRAAPKPRLAGVPDNAEATCLNCPDARACPNVSTCCGGKLSVNITVPCPRGLWGG